MNVIQTYMAQRTNMFKAMQKRTSSWVDIEDFEKHAEHDPVLREMLRQYNKLELGGATLTR